MKKARLFYTTWGSPRRAILSLALTGIFAAALVVWLGATPALAQSVTKPDPVTMVTVAEADIGETAAKVSWTLPMNTGVCARTRIDLRLYEITVDDPVVMGISLPKDTTSYVVQGLKANTKYQAEVYAFSSTCPGEKANHYSSPAYSAEFTTGAVNSGGNPTKPMGEQKMPPKRPGNLRVSEDSGMVMIRWDAATDDGVTRCPVSYYALYMAGRSDSTLMDSDFPVRENDIGLGETPPGTNTTVSASLESGKKYEVVVAAFSLECGEYSAAARKIYTHP